MTEPATVLTEPQLAAFAKVTCGMEAAGSVTLLCGPSGVGKTTVLRQLAGDSRIAGRIAAEGDAVRDVSGWLATGEPLPPLVLADDAHLAAEDDLARLLARCQRRPMAALVLAGQGRLLTLAGRDQRLTEATRLRVALLPGGLHDSAALLRRRCSGPREPELDEALIETIHEIAGGVPAACHRLAELAAVLAGSRPDGRLEPSDIEAIHRRLSPQAA